ncbi:hypothetical protein QZH41_004685 [Actinostola sp. cb2023]|nr:hypothetical protein QZH41_004685 [Actinostola sp. cb2023]
MGEKSIDGLLVSSGIRVQRYRLRKALRDADPLGRRLRMMTGIVRRVYQVHSPLSLWHMDGNHKLISLFLSMDAQGLLDPDNDSHLYCLHMVFLPRINDMLQTFVASWNNHKVRTAGNKTPLQLFIMGMQNIARHNGVIAAQYFENLSNEEQASYGIDPSFPLPADTDGYGVIVPTLHISLNTEDISKLEEKLASCNVSNVWDIEVYKMTLNYFTELHSQRRI